MAGADKDAAQQDGVSRLELLRMLCEAGADKDTAQQDSGSRLEVGAYSCSARLAPTRTQRSRMASAAWS